MLKDCSCKWAKHPCRNRNSSASPWQNGLCFRRTTRPFSENFNHGLPSVETCGPLHDGVHDNYKYFEQCEDCGTRIYRAWVHADMFESLLHSHIIRAALWAWTDWSTASDPSQLVISIPPLPSLKPGSNQSRGLASANCSETPIVGNLRTMHAVPFELKLLRIKIWKQPWLGPRNISLHS